MNELDHNRKRLRSFHLFAGAGGGILSDGLLGHRVVGACEIGDYQRRVLLQRQHDGHLGKFPVWDDIRTFDGSEWAGAVDILAGGFPCQDIAAGAAMHGVKGIRGERSGLWKEYKRVIGEMRPDFVWAENSPLLRTRGLNVVLSDLAELGYDARWCKLGAWHVGAAHRRDRLWILGYTKRPRLQRLPVREEDEKGWEAQSRPDTEASICGTGWKRVIYASDCSDYMGRGELDDDLTCAGCFGDYAECGCPGPTMDSEYDYQVRDGIEYARPRSNWSTECGVQRVAYGMAHRMDRFISVGNGQVPQCAAMAFRILTRGLL